MSTSPSPIAFRFWHSIAKCYVSDSFHAVLGDGRLLFWDVQSAAGDSWTSVELSDTPIRPEQWTGLLDRDGIQIFENDIVRVNGRLSVIQRRAGHWAASWLDYHLGTCAFLGGEPVVVGNANQHPDLLAQAFAP